MGVPTQRTPLVPLLKSRLQRPAPSPSQFGYFDVFDAPKCRYASSSTRRSSKATVVRVLDSIDIQPQPQLHSDRVSRSSWMSEPAISAPQLGQTRVAPSSAVTTEIVGPLYEPIGAKTYVLGVTERVSLAKIRFELFSDGVSFSSATSLTPEGRRAFLLEVARRLTVHADSPGESEMGAPMRDIASRSKVQGWDTMAEPDPRELQRERAKRRLEVVDAVLKATDSAADVATLVSSASDRSEAVSRLSESLAFSEFAAEYVVDVTFSRCTSSARRALREEREQLLATLEDSA
jgi:hypothetical protein